MAKIDSTMSVPKKLFIAAVALGSLFLVFIGVATVKNYSDFKPYRTLAIELNETLGGGYKISYTWNCQIESTNCPSVRMIKDANFKDNDEARAVVEDYKSKLNNNGYLSVRIGLCDADQYFKVYCTLSGNKSSKTVTINTKQDFIGIDIAP